MDIVLRRLSHQSQVALQSRPKPVVVHRPPSTTTTNNHWQKIALAPRDPIISISQLYKEDPNPAKINLSIGTYRTEDSQSFVFSSVRQAAEAAHQAVQRLEREYSPMEGYEEFNRQAFRLLFGQSAAAAASDKTSVTVQTLAGTGAIDLGAAFLGKFFEGRRQVFISRPSWINYYCIFSNYRFEVATYRYYDAATKRFDAGGFFDDLAKLPEHSVVMFQPCGHNPASVQPSPDDWQVISAIVREKKMLPFFDTAYHGLCSPGADMAADLYPVRLFAEHGHLMLVSQSFSKNMSLYGERIGSLTVLAATEEQAYRVRSQLRNLIISRYICPPSVTGRTVAAVLADDRLREGWLAELAAIGDRLRATRAALRARLEALLPDRGWAHLTEHSGIFWYSGLSAATVQRLINEHSVYLCEDGRVNMAGVNGGNLERLAGVIREVLISDGGGGRGGGGEDR